MKLADELFQFARKLEEAASLGKNDEVIRTLLDVRNAAEKVRKSFSGSWLGYHSRVYYQGLLPSPPGAHFSQEWGLKELFSSGSTGHWVEHNFDEVVARIMKLAGNPDMKAAQEAAEIAKDCLVTISSEIESIIHTENAKLEDPFLGKLLEDLGNARPLSKREIAQHWSPKGSVITRDTTAAGQGTTIPPHIEVLSEVASLQSVFDNCRYAAEIAKKAASHIERKKRAVEESERVGTNVFLGHGRSSEWRVLKDFIKDRLALPWDEFNRVPVAGVTNIARLSQMLDAAAVAFLVMTAEDELTEGGTQARMNVVHEAGLFQGRLGFSRAIVLLEEGCEEFSNIQGLGQIRFPKGNIGAAFEEIRRVLEREGLVTP